MTQRTYCGPAGFKTDPQRIGREALERIVCGPQGVSLSESETYFLRATDGVEERYFLLSNRKHLKPEITNIRLVEGENYRK